MGRKTENPTVVRNLIDNELYVLTEDIPFEKNYFLIDDDNKIITRVTRKKYVNCNHIIDEILI